MNKLFTLLGVLFCASAALTAQTVLIPTGLNNMNGVELTWIDAFIDADTNAAGEQNHDVYELVPGGNYVFTVNNKWAFDVTIQSAPRGENELRPFVGRQKRDGDINAGRLYSGTGNFTLRDIYLVAGDDGLDRAAYETSPIRPEGDNKRYVFENCIIEKSRQGTIRSEGQNPTVIVKNNLIRNFGDYKRQQGNGRVVDLRTNFGDTVIITGNVIHNILDRMYIGFRAQGLNYFEFNQNTVFNHVGRHGFIQLKNTKETVIKNNFIQNPSIIGSSEFLANEQINLKDVKTPIFTLDTLIEGGSVTMLNNNVHWTEDVLNHYATFDSVTKPELFSPVFEQALLAGGGSVDAAVFSEVLELNDVPSRQPLIDYAREAILFKDSTGITDIMVQNINFITALGRLDDFPYVYEFANFDPCYSSSSRSATAANGNAVGATTFCDGFVSIPREIEVNNDINLRVLPNPAFDVATFKYTNFTPGHVQLTIFDMSGKVVANVMSGAQIGAEQTYHYTRLGELAPGMYVAVVATPSGRTSTKFVKQ